MGPAGADGISGIDDLTTPRVPFLGAAGVLDDDGAMRWNDTDKTLELATGGQVLDAPAPLTLPQLHLGGDVDPTGAHGQGEICLDAHGGSAPLITGRRSLGTQAAKVALPAGVGLFAFRGMGYHSGGDWTGTRGTLRLLTREAWTPTAQGTQWVFGATPEGAAAPGDVAFLSGRGNVSINNTIADPAVGTKCLVLGDGVAPITLAPDTAAIYAEADGSGVVQLWAINEAGVAQQLTGGVIGGGGGGVSGLTAPRVPFAASPTALDDDPALRWNDTAKTLEVATAGQALDAPIAPAPQLHIGGNHVAPNGTGNLQIDGYGSGAVASFRRANGSQAAKTGLVLGDTILNVRAHGYHNGGAYGSGVCANLRVHALEAWSPTAQGAYWSFGATAPGVAAIGDVAHLTGRGNLSINNTVIDPTVGSKVLAFGVGTAPSGLLTDTAALYTALDIDGVAQIMGMSEQGFPFQLTGTARMAVTSTGTINDLDAGYAEVVYLDNASALTITGLLNTGNYGRRVTFISRGAGNVFFAHQSTSSGVNNRFLNIVTSGPTILMAARGTATFVYDGRWKLESHMMGGWLVSTYNGGEFTTETAALWTVAAGDVAQDVFTIIDRTLFWMFSYQTTSVSAATNLLRKTLPNGYSASAGPLVMIGVSDNGAAQLGYMSWLSATTAQFGKFPGFANWAVANNTTKVEGSAQVFLV